MPKSNLLPTALAHVAERIAEVEQQLDALDSDQAGETKSSAGDKFETSREMMAQQRDQMDAQLAVLREHKLKLEVAQRATPSRTIAIGSDVTLTDGRRFLIATGLGKVRSPAGAIFYVISPESPLGAALLGEREGSEVRVGARVVEIVQVG